MGNRSTGYWGNFLVMPLRYKAHTILFFCLSSHLLEFRHCSESKCTSHRPWVKRHTLKMQEGQHSKCRLPTQRTLYTSPSLLMFPAEPIPKTYSHQLLLISSLPFSVSFRVMIISGPDSAQCPHQTWVTPHLETWCHDNLTPPPPPPRMGANMQLTGPSQFEPSFLASSGWDRDEPVWNHPLNLISSGSDTPDGCSLAFLFSQGIWEASQNRVTEIDCTRTLWLNKEVHVDWKLAPGTKISWADCLLFMCSLLSAGSRRLCSAEESCLMRMLARDGCLWVLFVLFFPNSIR